jgi:alpha-amylase
MNNAVMMQYFHWYYPQDGSLWNQLAKEAPCLAKMGVTTVWLPPAFKAHSGNSSVGYDVYDLFDLGEFDQKGSIRTKYGTKEEYLTAIKIASEQGIKVYADIVINHLAGADESEKILAIKVNSEDRNEAVSEAYEIEAFTKFNYPVRNKKYSDFIWDATCFSGTDFDAAKNETGIFKISNEHGAGWEEMLDDEKGNYDYLMFSDIEFRNPKVREHLKSWGKWYKETAGFDGVRLDAVKHISPTFYKEWMDFMRENFGEEFFAVAEYWAPGDANLLEKYIEATEGKVSLFDSSLQNKFHVASNQRKDFDLSTIFDDTLVKSNPVLAVTVVDNHDTQPLQALEAPVANWFKPLAYALILLRTEGYPCIFYPDIYGAAYKDKGKDGQVHDIKLEPVAELEKLLHIRKNFCDGKFTDYMDHPNCIGWVWECTEGTNGCAVILSNGEAGAKTMHIGERSAGKKFFDFLGNSKAIITTNDNGAAEFICPAASLSVWCMQD